MNVNVHFMVKNEMQIKSGITINLDVGVKPTKRSCVQKILYGESSYMYFQKW